MKSSMEVEECPKTPVPSAFYRRPADIAVADEEDFYYRFHFLLNLLKTVENTGFSPAFYYDSCRCTMAEKRRFE